MIRKNAGYTLVEVAVSMVVLAMAASIGGYAMRAVESQRGYRNAAADAIALADAETMFILACNRNGSECGDTTYTAVCNAIGYSVERYVPGASLAHRAGPSLEGETVIAVRQLSSRARVWTFRLVQEALDDE